MTLLNEKIDWSGIDNLSPDLQKQTHDVIYEYHHLFSLEPMEIGKSKETQHEIHITNSALFKECFQQIPPGMLDEV